MSAETITLCLAQLNPTVGAVAANAESLRAARAKAAEAGAALVIGGELFLSGYPPEDLVLKNAFLDHVEETAKALARETADGGPGLLVGAPWRVDGRRVNAALLMDEGRISAVVVKHHLPNYGVFDEARVFTPGPVPGPVVFRGLRLGVMVCEDMWHADVAECLGECGAEILVVLNGSPFELDKRDMRLTHAVARVVETGLPLVYVNQVGGQDELVFDGESFVLDADRSLRLQVPSWIETVAVSRWKRGGDGVWTCAQGVLAPPMDRCEIIYQAMVLGLRDYVNKNGFPGVLIGLSGGVDSALSAVVAVDALGADRVHCVMMPSPHTSTESLEDAEGVARLTGARLDNIPIREAMEAFGSMLAPLFRGTGPDVTEENLQARIRGIVLMALSNKFGHMVLSTGNKSEMSVGYATLYGDMCGGYSVLKDVYKTTVFQLSRWRNAVKPFGVLGPDGPVMPERVITKPPTAELKPNQTDQDTLPPYADLDAVLKVLIEGEGGVRDAVAQGFDEALARRVWRMLDRAEYKRRQAPPGVKITGKAFGRDRRYPITNAYTGAP